ncbi:unnamed protein product [Effrenium voratum]|nr:unnamed protein product [Effrenium voratum]
MVLGLLAQNCFPLIFLLQGAEKQARCFARPQGRRRLVEELLQRLAYPHARESLLKTSHALLHVLWSLIQSFLGKPPQLQVATYEVDPFTFNHTVKLWDPRCQHKSRLLAGHTDTVLTVAMKGNIVVTGSYDCTAKAWDASRGVLLKTIINDCSVTAVGVEHSTIIIGGSNGRAAVGKLTGDHPVLDFRQGSEGGRADCVCLAGHSGGISAVLVHGNVAVTGAGDSTARIWHGSGQVKRVLCGHRRRINALSMHRNLQLLVTGSTDATARLWNAESGELLHILTVCPAEGACWPSKDPVVSVAMAGEFVAVGSRRGSVQVWNRKSGVLHSLARGEYGPLGSQFGLGMRDDGLLVACFKAGFAKAWCIKEQMAPFVLTTGFASHVANPSYALML